MIATPLDFDLSLSRRILFGAGTAKRLGECAAGFGRRALIIRSASLSEPPDKWNRIERSLSENRISFETAVVNGEPSPELVDAIVQQHSHASADVVVAIGGGSTLDAGKAVSAMLPLNEPVADYCESIGSKRHPGKKVPFIAVPTTAGTGSEASANAVLSRVGPEGFKVSLRHRAFVPDVALIDPELALSCPAGVTSACGMDAFTQLLEAFVSPRSTAPIDSLILGALPFVRDCCVPAATTGRNDIRARSGMAYASLISGIALAHAGLGVVHGIASSMGGLFAIPHGVVCGTLLAPAVKATIDSLLKSDPGHGALKKYADAGRLVSGKAISSTEEGCGALADTISQWTEILGIPRLSDFGISQSAVGKITSRAGNRCNPIALSSDQIAEIISSRI